MLDSTGGALPLRVVDAAEGGPQQRLLARHHYMYSTAHQARCTAFVAFVISSALFLTINWARHLIVQHDQPQAAPHSAVGSPRGDDVNHGNAAASLLGTRFSTSTLKHARTS